MGSVKIMWPIPWSADSAQSRIVRHLKDHGYEVNEARSGYRAFMYRKNSTQWTQAYTGLTKRAKQERNGFKIAGPESGVIPEFAFYEGGIFYGQADAMLKAREVGGE